MKKILKVVGCAGLLTSVILVVKKLDPSLYGILPEKPLATGVRVKVEQIAENVEHVIRYRYPTHDGNFTDSEKIKKLEEARAAFVAVLAAKKDNDVPENIHYVEAWEHVEPHSVFFDLGTKEGELAPFSDEYKVVINSAYEKSLKDENFTLKFFGSTYGIGTKGKESKDGSKVFAKDDIAKLKNKLAK
jgi:hypothetical protein